MIADHRRRTGILGHMVHWGRGAVSGASFDAIAWPAGRAGRKASRSGGHGETERDWGEAALASRASLTRRLPSPSTATRHGATCSAFQRGKKSALQKERSRGTITHFPVAKFGRFLIFWACRPIDVSVCERVDFWEIYLSFIRENIKKRNFDHVRKVRLYCVGKILLTFKRFSNFPVNVYWKTFVSTPIWDFFKTCEDSHYISEWII